MSTNKPTNNHDPESIIIHDPEKNITTQTIVPTELKFNMTSSIHSDTSLNLYSDVQQSSVFRHTIIENKQKGDSIKEKTNGNIRYLFQNVNSLRPKSLDKWKASLETIEQLQCDIVGLSETCVNWKINKTRRIYKSILRKKLWNSTMTTSKIKHFYKNNYLPGGTVTITTGKVTSKLEGIIEDPGVVTLLD
jgi:hypothetical protein